MQQFRDLAVGQTFDFIDPQHPDWNSFFRRCIKTGPRRYSTTDEPKMDMRVGSINVQVFHVRDEFGRSLVGA